jgi:hypothetical protein
MQPLVTRPLGEPHLDGQFGPDPMRVARVGSRDVIAERADIDAQRIESTLQLLQCIGGETVAHPADVLPPSGSRDGQQQ